MKDSTKQCKYCKSEIDKKAKVCPHCRKKQGGIVKWIVIGVIVLALIGSMGGESEETAETTTQAAKIETTKAAETTKAEETTTEKQIEYTVYSVSEMVEDLESNALRAESKYQDQYLEITGRLSVIDSDGEYITIVPEDEQFAIIGVQCSIENDEQLEKVMEMNVDDVITVRGQITTIGEVLGYFLDIHSFE